MKIILKPGGALMILGTLAALSALVINRVGIKTPLQVPMTASLASSLPTVAAFSRPSTQTAGGEALLDNGDFSHALTNWVVVGGVPTIEKKSPPTGTSQYLSQVVVPGAESWTVHVRQVLQKPLKSGDRVVFRGKFRSPQSLVLHLYIEERIQPRAKIVSKQVYTTPQWTEQSIVGTVKKDYAAGETQFIIHCGVLPGTLEIADFHLDDYGQTADSESSAATGSAGSSKPTKS